MRYAANLLVVSDSPDNAIEPPLRAAGYHCVRLSFRDMISHDFGSGKFDLILIDGDHNEYEVELKKLAELADFHNISMMIIGVDDVRCRVQTIAAGHGELELRSRVNALVRIETMHQELHRRVETLKAYGADFSDVEVPPLDIGDANILIVGSQTLMLGNILLRLDARAKLHICKDAEYALSDLREGEFDAVILSGFGLGDRHLRLCNDIRSDTRLYNLPVLMVLNEGDSREAAYIHGVSDVVLHEREMGSLLNRIGLQIRQHRYRYAMQILFRRARSHPVADGPTDLYSPAFLQAHLPLILREHDLQGKSLTVARLRILNIDEIAKDGGFPLRDHLLRQIGSMIGFLVRAEDFCASYDVGEFVLTLPGTRPEDARSALGRIRAVIGSTDFAGPEGQFNIRAEVAFDLVEPEIGDGITRLLARKFIANGGAEQAA
ncbi:MAG: diguanylate cyclase [Alphaproteobacteria bacterium]|nr:MAG: diguanylate cyclase [Alphaproteobacteria bacterium]